MGENFKRVLKEQDKDSKKEVKMSDDHSLPMTDKLLLNFVLTIFVTYSD